MARTAARHPKDVGKSTVARDMRADEAGASTVSRCRRMARAPLSCGIATAVTRPHQHAYRERREICRYPLDAGRRLRHPITRENADDHLQTIKMSGKEVYKQAVIAMVDAAKKALEKAGLTIDDIACVIPHQANVRIIEAIADRLKIPVENFS